jgi:microtubule-associated protein-like 5/microtubule-associated protein-like 6
VNIALESSFGQACCITDLQYLSFFSENSLACDIVVANNFGEIGIISNGRYFVVNQSAHTKTINCIRTIEIFGLYVFVTAGEDEHIRFWDRKFNKIAELHMKQARISSHYPFAKNPSEARIISPQSLDHLASAEGRSSIS